MNLRFADEHDAAACLAIYAQYIDTSITFETALPSEDCLLYTSDAADEL